MEKVIFGIVGETGAGKNSLARKVSDENGIVVSYTTRPSREGEIEGREHFFISDKEYDELQRTSHVVAPCNTGKYRYCATVESIVDGSLYLIEPSGVQWFKDNKVEGLRMVTIGIHVSLEERRARCKDRSDYSTAFDKRVADEQMVFANYRLNGNFDYMITNHDLDKASKVLAFIMRAELDRE